MQARSAALAEFGSDTGVHLRSCIFRIREGQNLLGARMTIGDQVCNAPGENGSFSSSGARDNQHGPVNVLDRLALMIVRNQTRGGRTAF